MTNKFMIQPEISVAGKDDHLMITGHFKDGLHNAVLFQENGRTISVLTTISPDGIYHPDWELCPGALKGEVVYHKKASAQPRVGGPRVVCHGYCTGYHNIVWSRKGSNSSTPSH